MFNELKARPSISWDELVLDAVCAHYELHRAAIALLKRDVCEEEKEGKDRSKGESSRTSGMIA